MKTLVVVSAALALACTAFTVGQERQEKGKEAYGQHQEKAWKGVKVISPHEIEWKQAEEMPQGVMMAKVAKGKHGGMVAFAKFPAGTKIPLHTCGANEVIHVHSGQLQIGESGQPMEGQGKTVEAGGVAKISGDTPHWLFAPQETLVLISLDGPKQLRMTEPQRP